jgi:hypothetical protein
MGVRVASGEGRLIASGTITTFFGAPLELDLVDWGYSVVWRFEEDGGDVRLDVLNSEEGIELTAYNFVDGRGTAQPMALVRRDAIGLWLHFRVFRHGNTLDRTVHSTVWAQGLTQAESPD